MNPYVIRIIEEYECPLINSLIYADGNMLVLESYKSRTGKYTLRILCASTIESYFEHNPPTYVSSISVPASAENDDYQILAGGGSMGGDGVVFVMDKKTQRPLWFLFLDNSDPFDSIVFDSETHIICGSTSGLKINFPILQPAEMKVFD